MGGVSYGLLAVLSGSAQQGRIGTLVVLVVLPWLAHSALFLFPAYHQAPASNPDRAWRATFRTALWLALAACFAPLLLVLAGAVTLTAFAVWGITDRALFRAVWRYLMVLLVVAVVLLLPWAALMWSNHGGADWLFEFGRPASELIGARDAWDLALGRPGAVGSAPPWLSAVLMIAAIAALLRRDTRRRVVACWWVIVVAFAAAGMLNGLRLVEATTGVDELVWSGVPLLIAQAAAILAVAIAATGLREVMASHAFGWRQLTSAALILAVAVSTLLGLGWWAVQGTGDPEQGLVDRRAVTAVPRYMTDAAETDPGQGVLVIRGDQRAGFRYQVLRERGLRLGDDSVLPTAVEQEPLTRLVGALAASPDGTDVDRLAGLGVRFVYAPPPVDSQLAGNLDVTDGLERASAPAPARVAGSSPAPGQVRSDPNGSGTRHGWACSAWPWSSCSFWRRQLGGGSDEPRDRHRDEPRYEPRDDPCDLPQPTWWTVRPGARARVAGARRSSDLGSPQPDPAPSGPPAAREEPVTSTSLGCPGSGVGRQTHLGSVWLLGRGLRWRRVDHRPRGIDSDPWRSCHEPGSRR